jgi:hypothetical protein
MRVEFFKDKKYIQIWFFNQGEEDFFREIMQDWGRLEKNISNYIDTVDKIHNEHTGEGKQLKPWHRKKLRIIRQFLRSLFGYDIAYVDELKDFATNVQTKMEIGKFIDETIEKGYGRQILSRGNQTVN